MKNLQFSTSEGGGTQMKERVAPSYSNTQAQQGVRNAFKKAAQGWRGLSLAAATEWNSYAAIRREESAKRGTKIRLSGFNWYVRYGSKFVAANAAGATVPSLPPTVAFGGDPAVVLSSVTGSAVVFTASVANLSTVTTELMIQKISNPNAKPNKDGYRIRMFKQFSGAGILTQSIPVGPGTYACGYQCVEKTSGQLGPFVSLGVQTIALAVEDGGLVETEKPVSRKKAA